MLPLILRIKKTAHKEIARAQDLVVECLYTVFNDAVFHGGTSIWRCYQGNRFSEDIDIYLKKDIKKLDLFFNLLEKRGFVIEKKKISENGLYSVLKLNRTRVSVEALFKKMDGSLKEYESVDGNLLSVYTLTPEQLIKEKVATYLSRFKIRDLYDIFFLLRYIPNKVSLKKELDELLSKFKKPIDEPNLRVLILEGLVPDTQKMVDYIRRGL